MRKEERKSRLLLAKWRRLIDCESWDGGAGEDESGCRFSYRPKEPRRSRRRGRSCLSERCLPSSHTLSLLFFLLFTSVSPLSSVSYPCHSAFFSFSSLFLLVLSSSISISHARYRACLCCTISACPHPMWPPLDMRCVCMCVVCVCCVWRGGLQQHRSFDHSCCCCL